MSPTPIPINPSQTVERIREILVGRQLDRIEQRVSRLESGPSAVTRPAGLFEDRLFANEAQIEALRENVYRHTDAHREEIQRLANQIQQVAEQKATAAAQPEILRLENKVATWLTHWQKAFQAHLHERDQRLASQLRDEVAALWENTESQITRLESRAVDRDAIEERFSRIALAARALAECASPSKAPQRGSFGS